MTSTTSTAYKTITNNQLSDTIPKKNKKSRRLSNHRKQKRLNAVIEKETMRLVNHVSRHQDEYMHLLSSKNHKSKSCKEKAKNKKLIKKALGHMEYIGYLLEDLDTLKEKCEKRLKQLP